MSANTKAEVGINAYKKPEPISIAPLTSNGKKRKIWIQTPYESAHGISRNYGWQSPAPTLSLGTKHRKTRRTRKARKSRRQSK
jgi:hypothetical protein